MKILNINQFAHRYHKFEITPNAYNEIAKLHDLEILPLAIENIRNTVVKVNKKKTSILSVIKDYFYEKPTLKVSLDKKENGKFFISTEKTAAGYQLKGDCIPINLDIAAVSKKYIQNIIQESKLSILDQFERLNRRKNYNKKLYSNKHIIVI